MNDYWNYLEHGLLGKEQKGHKYYARVPVGKNKLGFTQYRYFYDAREYGAYMTNQKNGNGNLQTQKTKGYTTYVTGRGNQMLPSSIAKEDMEKLRGTGVATTHKMTNEKGEWTGASAVGRDKTVKDYGRPIREAKESVKKTLHEARDSHNSNRWHKTGSITFGGAGKTGTYTETNRINGKTRRGEINESNYKEFNESGWKKHEEDDKKAAKYERIYQAEKFARRVRVASKKGALRVKRLLKNLGNK